MRNEIELSRELLAEGTPENFEKALDLLLSATKKDKPVIHNQLLLVKSELKDWMQLQNTGQKPSRAKFNRMKANFLAVLGDMEKGKTARIPAWIVNVQAGFAAIYDMLGGPLFSVVGFILFWAIGGYVTGMIWANIDNGDVPDDIFYENYVMSKLESEIVNEASQPDGKVYYTCGKDLTYEGSLAEGTWAQVSSRENFNEIYAGTPKGVIVPAAVIAGAIPLGFSNFRSYFMASLKSQSNVRSLVYFAVFFSGVGYGYYSHRRKVPACGDEEVLGRLRSTDFQQKLGKSVADRLNYIKPVQGIRLDKSQLLKIGK